LKKKGGILLKIKDNDILQGELPLYNGVGIYKITNINNGKIYIGSSKHVNTRMKEHLYRMQEGRHGKAINADVKSGHKFAFDVLEEIEDGITLSELLGIERQYIELYKTYRKGYNGMLPQKDAAAEALRIAGLYEPNTTSFHNMADRYDKYNEPIYSQGIDYDFITILTEAGKLDVYKAQAELNGKSLNQFIIDCIEKEV
jgi:hypothetical protein